MAATADLIFSKLRQRYPAAVSLNQISESFNKADGPLVNTFGPDLFWTRVGIFTPQDAVVANNQLDLDMTNAVEDNLMLMIPNTHYRDISGSVVVTDLARISGTGIYNAAVGPAFRTRFGYADTSIDCYSVEINRTNLGSDQWFLSLNKYRQFSTGLASPEIQFDSDSTPAVNITLPQTLTFAAIGSNLSGSFGPLSVSAVDDEYQEGLITCGFAGVAGGGQNVRVRADNFQVTATIPDAAGDLLSRYRTDQGLATWEQYVAHVAGASPSGNFGDDENAFWDAFVP